MASPISQAIKQICDEKNIPYDSVLETIESALAAAYRKDFGNKNQNIQVEFDPEKYDGAAGGIRVFDAKTVVEDMELPDDYFERFDQSSIAKRQESLRPQPKPIVALDAPAPVAPAPAPALTPAPDANAAAEEEEFKFNPKTMIMLRDARDVKPDAVVGEEIRVELAIPAAFGRMAAQTAKQVIMQKLREAERGIIYSDFKGREGELMNVTVQRREGRIVLIDLGRATGILLPDDQIDSERYYPGTRIKALLREVALTPKGPEIRLSRSHPELVIALFAQEIPEVANGIVQIKSVAREAGSRTKVAVTTNDDAIDPIGSCIGQRGTRIQSVIRELGGEKVDVVLWSDDAGEFIASSLSPAKVTNVDLNQDTHLASVTVTPDQLSLAIGKGGQNVRLAAKLTNWKITIAEEGGSTVADSDIGQFEGIKITEEGAKEITEESTPPEGASPLDEAEDKAERAEDADIKGEQAEEHKNEEPINAEEPTEEATEEKKDV